MPTPLAFVKSVGTNTSSSAAVTTLAVTVPSSGCAVGNLVVIHFCGFNYTSGTVSIADTRSNTWASNFVKTDTTFGINQVWSSILSTALVNSDTITVTFPAANQCYAMTADEFTGLSPVAGQPWAVDATGTTANNSTTPSDTLNPGATTPAVLWYGALSVDSPTAETFTEDNTNTVGGLWVTGTPALSASNTNPQTVRNSYKIPNTSLSSSQTWAPTLGTARDWIETLIVFSGAGTGRTVGRMSNATRRASTY